MIKRSISHLGYSIGRFGLLGPPIGYMVFMAPMSLKDFLLFAQNLPFGLIFAYAGGMVPAILAGVIFGGFQIALAHKSKQIPPSRILMGLLGLAAGAIAILIFFAYSGSFGKENSSIFHYLLSGCISGTLCGLSCKIATVPSDWE